MTRFVVIFEGRNGSSQLVSLLNSHPSVLCYPEILVNLPRAPRAAAARAQQREVMTLVAEQQDVRTISAYAGEDRYHRDGFEAKWRAKPFQAIGFKTKVTDFVHIPDAMLALQQHEYRLIYLNRNNILKSVISLLNAGRLRQKHGNIFNPRRTDQVMGSFKVDFAEFEPRLARRRLAESLHLWFYDNYALPKMRIAYEDMLGDEAGAIGAVCDFIGVERRDLHGTFLKNTPPRLSEAVTNYDEFAGWFRNTDLAAFLD